MTRFSRRVLAAVVLLLSVHRVSASCPDFLAPSRFGTGFAPYAVAIADLDADGNMDIAVANKDFSSISVLEGNGFGYFGADVTYGTGSGPRGIVAADLNGDNYTDLAVANSMGDSVAVLLNNTFGGFAAAVTYATDSPYAIVAADFSGDGKVDLAVANYDIHKVSILVNGGTGTFATAVPYSGFTNPTALKAINVDSGDSDIDLVVANGGSNTVSVIKNNGSAVFGAPDHYTVGSSPTGVTAGDFNGDARVDIAASVWTGNAGNVAVLLANQNGGYDAAVSYAVGLNPVGIHSAGMDDDGILDLVTVNMNDDSVSVLLGNVNGTFDPAATYGTGYDPSAIAIDELNGDDELDVVVTNSSFSEVSVLFGAGGGVLAAEYLAGEFPNHAAVGDFDEDGNKDLAVATGALGLAIMLGNGNGNFAPAVLYAIPTLFAQRLDLGDVNNDGITDIVVVATGSNPIRVFLGNGTGGVGDGTFSAGNNYAAGTTPSDVAIGLLDGDANLDLAISNQFANNFSVMTGNGDGTFDAAVDTETGSSYGAAVSIANLDGDTDNDVVLVTYDQISVHLGSGVGTFGAAANYTAGINPRDVVVANFDGDGDLDLAVANANSDKVSIFKNNGNGTFASKVDYDAGSEPRSVTAADFDGDGKIDLALANNWGSPYRNFAILTGNGDATFDAPFYGGWAYGGWTVSAADFDNNGGIDLAVVLGQTVEIALNRGTCATTGSASPNMGPTAGGTSVTVTGTNLSGAVSVTFGGSDAVITGNTATTVTATTPPHAAAPVDVVVKSAGGIATLAGGFTYGDLPAVPTGLVAGMVSLSNVGLTWNAVSGATSYKVERKAAGGGFVEIGTPGTNALSDGTVASGSAYLYRVRAVGAAGESANSAPDLATVVAFTNVPLTTSTLVDADHLAQLRAAVDAVRTLAGIGNGSYTDSASVGTIIKAVHFTELRTQLDLARSPLGLSTGGYTDASLSGVAVKTVHVQDLRDRVQ